MKTIKNIILVGVMTIGLGVTSSAQALMMYPIEDYQPVVVVNHVRTKTVVDPAPVVATTTTSSSSTTKTSTTKSNTITTPAKTRTDTNLQPVVNSDQPNNGLTALSLAGSGGFMPSSVWQWLLVILLILAIIVIARMLSRPHVNHEVHTVASH